MFFAGSREIERARSLISRPEARERSDSQSSSVGSCVQYLGSLFGEERLRYAGVTPTERETLGRKIGVVSVLSLTLTLLLWQPLFLLMIPLTLLVLSSSLGVRANKRSASFDRDYAALLLSLSSGVKTGLDPLVALGRSGELFQPNSIMRSELDRVNEVLEQGGSEDEAVLAFGSTVRHPDLRLFQLAFILARKEGSSLSECLRRLAKVTRQRQSFRRKVRSAVAMQKLSAFGIGGCALVIGFIQASGNPEAIQLALNHPVGIKLIVIGLVLILAGIVWMCRLSTSSGGAQ